MGRAGEFFVTSQIDFSSVFQTHRLGVLSILAAALLRTISLGAVSLISGEKSMSFKDWLERLDPWSNLISLLVGIIGTVATLATLSSNPRGEISYQGNIIRLIDADRVANSLTVSASKDHGR
jgi:hypothetical protein